MDDNKLIFLISQPRSGSTLTQRLLGFHTEIVTVGEPWVMFPLGYQLKDSGIAAEYNARVQKRAFAAFLNELGDGAKDTFIKDLSNVYTSLYERRMASPKVRYFLDKTPRYYFIINELQQLFPDAKFLFLVRNPVAVLNSILRNWVGDEVHRLADYGYDLFTAPSAIDSAQKRTNAANQFFVQYEQLVHEPIRELEKVCGFLDIDPNQPLAEKLGAPDKAWAFGDKATFEMNAVLSGKADAWKNDIHNENFSSPAGLYLELLGRELVESLGYSYEELCTTFAHVDTSKDSKPLEMMREAYRLSKQDFDDIDVIRADLVRSQIRARRLERNYEMTQDRAKALAGKIDEKNNEIKTLRTHLEAKRADLIEQKKVSEDRQKRIEEKNKLLDNFRGQVARVHEIVEEKNRLLENFRGQVARAHEIIEDKNRSIGSLQKTIGDQAKRVSELETEVKLYHPIRDQLRRVGALSFRRKPWKKLIAFKNLLGVLRRARFD